MGFHGRRKGPRHRRRGGTRTHDRLAPRRTTSQGGGGRDPALTRLDRRADHPDRRTRPGTGSPLRGAPPRRPPRRPPPPPPRPLFRADLGIVPVSGSPITGTTPRSTGEVPAGGV